MSTQVKAESQCPGCGQVIPAGAPAGLCPACLLAQGTATDLREIAPAAGFQPPSIAELATLFPQLEILRLLGAGGMGAVYQARQPALDRFVALKILPAGRPGGTAFAERFNREARALARLSHPNIVAVHEFGQAGTLHYFLMEFVDGTNLRQLERAGRLSPREALQIIPQICDALQYAHDEGVVHRDIKPENVLVDRKGRVKIADFGLAKIMSTDPAAARLTVEGQVMGTPHYMAPEQLERPLAVDHRADIYSLGVVFYEMLTGDLPLGKFPPPSRKVEVDVRLDEVVLRALENDPARRYQHASEVREGITSVVSTDAPSPLPEVGKAKVPGARQASRRWHGVAGWVTITAALAVGVLAWLVFQPNWLTAELRQRLGAPPPVDSVAAPDPQTGTWVARLPGEGRVELLALSDPESAPDGWWRPDGAPASDLSLEAETFALANPNAMLRKRFVLVLRDLPEGASGPQAEFEPRAAFTSGGRVLRGGQREPGAWPFLVGFPPSTRRATLRVGLGLEPWRTIATQSATNYYGTQDRLPDDPPWTVNLSHDAAEARGEAQISYVFGDHGKVWAHRLVAVDTNAVEHVPSRMTATPADRLKLYTAAFRDLPLAAVKEFRMQVRRVHWTEFRDVALEPRTPLARLEPAVFGPVLERTFGELVDFDTGRTADFPPGQPGEPTLAGVGGNVLWAQENGFDAVAGTDELRVLDMIGTSLTPAEWDTLSPEELRQRLMEQPSRLRRLRGSADGEEPATFGFRTREGGFGVLQLVAFDPARPQVTVRFKIQAERERE
jgi:hypothetical protein